MDRNDIVNQALRKYVQTNLTPTAEERSWISLIYQAVCSVLSDGKCLQIGSYPRFTAIRPPHDLDVLYIIGNWDRTEPRPYSALLALKEKIDLELAPPQGFTTSVELQTHSITIKFIRNNLEIFAVDIVPAFITEFKNEFHDDIYLVPEIVGLSHQGRLKKYSRVKENIERIDWILTDPRGYISVATALNRLNDDFRKSVKLPKKWKAVSKEQNGEFKLKSFHIEQIITSYFRSNPSLTILEAATKFFVELPLWLTHSQIPDRADASKNIDAYVDELTTDHKSVILRSRDEMLEGLKVYQGEQDAEVLFTERSFAATANPRASAATVITMTGDERRVFPRSSFGE